MFDIYDISMLIFNNINDHNIKDFRLINKNCNKVFNNFTYKKEIIIENMNIIDIPQNMKNIIYVNCNFSEEILYDIAENSYLLDCTLNNVVLDYENLNINLFYKKFRFCECIDYVCNPDKCFEFNNNYCSNHKYILKNRTDLVSSSDKYPNGEDKYIKISEELYMIILRLINNLDNNMKMILYTLFISTYYYDNLNSVINYKNELRNLLGNILNQNII